MKKRVLAGLLTLCMLLALLPVAAFAVEGSADAMDFVALDPHPADENDLVAKLNGKTYTLADAIAEAEPNETITLLKDVELETELDIDEAVTIDFAGHIIVLANDSAEIAVGSGKKVTMKNGSIMVDKAEDADKNATVSVVNMVTNSGDLTLEDMLLDATQSEDGKVTGAVLTIGGGKLTVTGKTQIVAVTDKQVEDATNKATLIDAIKVTGATEITFDKDFTGVVRGAADLAAADEVTIEAGTFDTVALPADTDKTEIFGGTFAVNARIGVDTGAADEVEAILVREIDDDTAYTNFLAVYYQDSDEAAAAAEAGDYMLTLNDGKQTLYRADYDEGVKYVLDPIDGFHLTDDKPTVVNVSDKNTPTTVEQDEDGNWVLTMPANSVEVTGWYKVCASVDMKDVARDAWYHDYIDTALANDWMQGNGNGTFTPNQELTRAMLIQVLYNVAKAEAEENDTEITVPVDLDNFADATGAWYSNAVLWAKDIGLAEGYGDNKFGPNDKLTREQMVTMLWRYDLIDQGKGDDLEKETDKDAATYNKRANNWLKTSEWCEDYTDNATVSTYAARAFAWALTAVQDGNRNTDKAENQIISGMTKTTLAPQGTATRAQLAKILSVYMNDSDVSAALIIDADYNPVVK